LKKGSAGMKPTVLLDPSFRRMKEIFTKNDRERLYDIADVVWGKDRPIPAEKVAKVRKKVVAVVGSDWRYGPIERFPRLRAFLEVSGRFPDSDYFDFETCFRRGIRVLSCAPAFGPAVAEMALGLALAAARNIPAGDAAVREGRERFGLAGNIHTFHLYDQTVGFIGFGGLARALKPLLAPFRCRIQVYDPWLSEGFLRAQGVVPAGLNALLGTSKVIFVLAAPSASNQALLSRKRLERIRNESVLVLISRAHLVDFDALTQMLYAGRFRAAIDVFPKEPIPKRHPIRKAPGVVLSAHRAGGDAKGFRGIGRIVVNDLEAILAGHPPQEMQAAQPEFIRNLGPR
jgi:phosphoglycerate dehydrogenase-like enzyme